MTLTFILKKYKKTQCDNMCLQNSHYLFKEYLINISLCVHSDTKQSIQTRMNQIYNENVKSAN